MDSTLRSYLAELLGTFVLVLVGAGTVCAYYLTTAPPLDVTAFALAEGFTLAVLITAVWPLSPGCFNPAITLMLYVFKRLELRRMLTLIAMQLLGAALAGLALRLMFSTDVLKDARFGAPYLKEGLLHDGAVRAAGLISGVGIEMLLTALVTVAVFATLLDPRGPRMGGVAVGLAQAAAVLFGFRLTGGAANPARWFGPVVWELTLPGILHPLADHAVYWAGPILGALLGGFAYGALILPADRTSPRKM
jgi:glycerol uptake facilitator-like aquaporin